MADCHQSTNKNFVFQAYLLHSLEALQKTKRNCFENQEAINIKYHNNEGDDSMYKDTDIKGQTANKVQFLSVISMKEMSPFKFLLSTRNRISTTNKGISQRKKISFKSKLKEKKFLI